MLKICLALLLIFIGFAGEPAKARLAGAPSARPLRIVHQGQPKAAIMVADAAGPWEKKAASDLQKYIRIMTGAELPLVTGAPAKSDAVIYVGSAATRAEPSLSKRLTATADPKALVQGDAISVLRRGRHLYVAGCNDESHYFAVSWLLQQWGARWYLPTEFGEVIPHHRSLAVGALDHSYAPPFEIRHYWISWNGDSTGADEFRHRNFMSDAKVPGMGHALGAYTAEIAPGGDHFKVPFSDPRTAEHVAAKIEADYAAGKDISLAIADGTYDNEEDKGLIFEYDSYFLRPSLTDAMLTFYNSVAAILRRRHPESNARIGGLAYANVTLPPRKVRKLEPNLFIWLAPIDVDPNHAMDDERSPPRRKYAEWVEAWAKVSEGRLVIYDYDQGMLVWRDLPNPSHHVFERDAKEYRRIGVMGFGTESRGATATTFLNLFFRGQLMWNPDADVDRMLKEFYAGFYGPAAGPLSSYWNRIFEAWRQTRVTEHEYMVVPAIYTPDLVDALRQDLAAGEAALAGAGPEESILRERLKFTRLSFDVIDHYVAMLKAAATEGDYAAAAESGEKALAARTKLALMNPTFTTGIEAENAQAGAAFFPGEVKQVKHFASLTDGTRGRILARLPLEWSFRIEQPLPPGWVYRGPFGPGETLLPAEGTAQEWRTARTDLYLQAQGLMGPKGESPLGFYRYQTTISLPAKPGSAVRIIFPGLFNEAWLYLNGKLVGHRPFNEPWWKSDYSFTWDVDLTNQLKPGENTVTLRGFNPHHFGGMFRRPFLYEPVAAPAGRASGTQAR